MRKDKLDEIKNILNYEYEIYFLKRNEVIPYHKITKENLKWLIEQVKRVQELEEQNKRYRETMESSVSEIKYALYSNKSKDVKEHYLKNAERYITEALE